MSNDRTIVSRPDGDPRTDATIVSGQPGQTGGDATIVDANGTIVSPGGSSRGTQSHALEMPPVEIGFTALNGLHYVLDCGDVIGSGGEAVIVRATGDDGRQYAAKIAFIQPIERHTTEHIIDMLVSRTTSAPGAYRTDHLMPIFAWGTLVARPLGYRTDTELMVSIMPVCECLEGQDLSPELVKETIMPSLAEGLKFLHDRNIVHRDVKPSNVYMYEECVVLGDFGISTILEQGENVRDTRLNRRTPGYTPDQNGVLKENDWYALGYTLWTMYNHGVHPYQQYIEEEVLTGEKSTVMKQVEFGYRQAEFEPRAEGDETFGQLIFGLTSGSRIDRLGYDDIQRYLRDPDSFYYSDDGMSVFQKSLPYVFEGETCKDPQSLALAMSGKWEEAKRHLYSGSLRQHFVQVQDGDLASTLYDIVETNRETISNHDIGLMQAIYAISKEKRILSWKGTDCSFGAVVRAFSSRDPHDLAEYDEILSKEILAWGMEQNSAQANNKGFQNAIAVTRKIAPLFSGSPFFARCLFRHLFASGGTSKWAGSKTAEAHIERVLSTPFEFYTMLESAEELDDVLAAFAPFALSNGHLQMVIGAHGNIVANGSMPALSSAYPALAGRGAPAAESPMALPPMSAPVADPTLKRASMTLLFMDVVTDGSPTARAFANEFGPYGGYLWAARHASAYVSPDATIQDMDVTKLSASAPAEGADVKTIMSMGDAARHVCDRLFTKIPRTPLPQRLGYVSFGVLGAPQADTIPCSKFYGDAVPRGFVRELLHASHMDTDANWGDVSFLGGHEDASGVRAQFGSSSAPYDRQLRKVAQSLPSKRSCIATIVVSILVIVAGALVAMVLTHPEMPLSQDIWLTPLTDSIGQGLDLIRQTSPDLPTELMSLPMPSGLLLLTALSAITFFAVILTCMLLSYRRISTVMQKQSERDDLYQQGLNEISAYEAGQSDLAKNFRNLSWNGTIISLDLISKQQATTQGLPQAKPFHEGAFFKMLWGVTSCVPSSIMPLAIVWTINDTIGQYLTSPSCASMWEELNKNGISIKAEDIMANGALVGLWVFLAFVALFVTWYILMLRKKRLHTLTRDMLAWAEVPFVTIGLALGILVALSIAVVLVALVVIIVVTVVTALLAILAAIAMVGIAIAILIGLVSS